MRFPTSIIIGLVALFLSAASASLGWGQQYKTYTTSSDSSIPPATTTTDSAQSAVATTSAEPALAVPAAIMLSSKGLVSLDFQDADIKNVLKVLAYKSGTNIVAGPEVTGTITIQLTDVPWQKALEVVLSTYGYGYERRGNIIMVTTIENLKKRHEETQLLSDQEPLMTKTYLLNFAKASEVVDSISKMKTSRGQINFDPRTNAVIVRDVQGNMDLIDDVIKTLDTVTPQILIEAKIVETTLSNTENLGIDWTVKGTATGASHPTVFPFVSNNTNKFLPSHAFADPTGTPFTYGTLSAQALSAVLEMLHARTDTHILSNPKIVTLDNQAAKIVVGTQFPIPQYTYNQEQAKLQVSGWEYKDIGIIFNVTPHVNNANLVTLDLHPTVTDITSSAVIESTTLPILSVEEAVTKVMVADGQTLVIAGLIKNKTTLKKKKVPFLGDIPLLGEAFKKKEDGDERTELLIFLTPHIITANNPSTVASSGK